MGDVAMCVCRHPEDLHARSVPSLSPYSPPPAPAGRCHMDDCKCTRFEAKASERVLDKIAGDL
jgi:hypothetical protein